MRLLTLIVLAVAGLYSGYWFIGASAVENGAKDAIVGMQDQGWEVRHGGLNTAGFPNRFDTTLTGPDIRSPDGALHWQAPFLQVFALSYRPNEVIAVLPNQQSLTLMGQTLDLISQDMRASLRLRAATDLALQNLTASSGPLTARSDRGWEVALGTVLTGLRKAPIEGPVYDSYLRMAGIIPPFVASELTSGLLPDEIGEALWDARITTSAPIDRHLSSGTVLYVTEASLRDVSLTWGETSISLAGDVTIGADGAPSGTITLSVLNWPVLLTAAANAGLIDDQSLLSVSTMARSAAGGAPDLSVPITLRNGVATMGFIPLGTINLRF